MKVVAINGAFVGLIYGLLAVGLVTIYRVSRIVNFAYGETGMLAAFVFFAIRLDASPLGVIDHGIAVALPVAILLGAAIGACMEWLIARPLRGRATVNGMVATIGASVLLIAIATEVWGSEIQTTLPMLQGTPLEVGGLFVSRQQLLIAFVTVAALVVLGGVYRFTSFGVRLRATATDPYAAALCGINTNAIAMATWAMAGALAAMSAILIAPIMAMSALFMTLLALRSFAAALIGGLTSLLGAFIAGVGLGVFEGVVAFKSPVKGATDVLVAAGILLLLVLRPGGIVRASY